MEKRFYGAKYDTKLSNKEIAAKIRTEIKAMVKAGTLPAGLKTSVRYKSFAGGSSIDVEIKALGFPLFNPEWFALEAAEPHRGYDPHGPNRYTAEALCVKEDLEKLHKAYNHDGSDIMTDYFDVNYYGSVGFDWELEKAEREALVDAPKAEAAPEVPKAPPVTIDLSRPQAAWNF